MMLEDEIIDAARQAVFVGESDSLRNVCNDRLRGFMGC